MNRNSATKLIESHGLTILRWNGSFKIAFVRTAAGVVEEIHIDGDKDRMLKRLKPFRAETEAQAQLK